MGNYSKFNEKRAIFVILIGVIVRSLHFYIYTKYHVSNQKSRLELNLLVILNSLAQRSILFKYFSQQNILNFPIFHQTTFSRSISPQNHFLCKFKINFHTHLNPKYLSSIISRLVHARKHLQNMYINNTHTKMSTQKIKIDI